MGWDYRRAEEKDCVATQVPVGDPVLCGGRILCDSFLLASGSQRRQHSNLCSRHLPPQLGGPMVCNIRLTNIQVDTQQALPDQGAELSVQAGDLQKQPAQHLLRSSYVDTEEWGWRHAGAA